MRIILRQALTAMMALSLTWVASLSHAQADKVGTVKTVTGDAWVITSGQRVKAKVGTDVHLGSQLKTAKSSSMGVTFKDNTLMSFGPDTEMTVDDYLFAPSQGQLKLGTRLDKGSLNYVSGLIAKLKPEAVTVKTPTGTIGVRGTQFLLNIEEPARSN